MGTLSESKKSTSRKLLSIKVPVFAAKPPSSPFSLAGSTRTAAPSCVSRAPTTAAGMSSRSAAVTQSSPGRVHPCFRSVANTTTAPPKCFTPPPVSTTPRPEYPSAG